jgi:hypothetical protein
MKKLIINKLVWVACFILFFAGNSFSNIYETLPDGWSLKGDHRQCYVLESDFENAHSGNYSVCLRSVDYEVDAFGTIAQACRADKFKGKRIKMSGFIKTSEVIDAAVLWLRVDAGAKTVGFDNMLLNDNPRPVWGTTDWQEYSIVLDVSEDASVIIYGALMMGTGQMWLDDLTIEIVDKSFETTGVKDVSIFKERDFMIDPSLQIAEPYNLDFEKVILK